MILTSSRRFGVEIEFIAPSKETLALLQRRMRLVADGSLRPLENAAEYVSNILEGRGGENELRNNCELLKKTGCTADNIKTSVHVHLDGRSNGQGYLTKTKTRQPETQLSISKAVLRNLNNPEIMRLIEYGVTRLRDEARFVVSRFPDNETVYLSKLPLKREPKLNYSHYRYIKRDRFNWLRNVFYFYTLYADVMSGLVSNSRKYGNMYCIPLNQSFDLDDIEGARTMEQLRNVWYKGNDTHSHYDDSRYHAVNLHSFWNRHGTVEIRSHGGTIDPDKILLWVKLHQKIVDKLEDIDLSDIKFTSNDNPHKKFVEFVEEPLLQEYVKRLLGYYSNIKVK